ncbi:MAG: broad specificity phosphatase PhoE, partial [Acidimicrobiales bacterium]
MLILLRHGRTKANAGGLLQGRIDLELDDLGQQQAQAAAAAIGKADRVIASPLVRAQQTAAAFGQPVETDERFIELDYGDWEAKPVKDVPVETWNEWRSDLDFRPPNGETLNELGSRVRGALADLAAEAVHQNIVVVSHVSPI